MPELPEVETIKRDLVTHLKGDTIRDVTFLDTDNLRNITPGQFCSSIRDLTIKSVSRMGKMLCFSLSGGYVLLVHLRMTGKFFFLDPGAAPPAHSRILFRLERSGILVFSDIRKFGMVYLTKHENLDDVPYLRRIGIDPFAGQFTPELLRDLLDRHSRMNTKSFLLDQHLIAGIGNIYASEILFESRIDPLKKTGDLSRKQVDRLYHATRDVLSRAVEARGTTFSDYRDLSGETGSFQHALRVYDREGQSCGECRGTIQRIVQGGRSTYFCPACQR